MRVNGTEIQVAGNICLADFLTQQGYDCKKVAVERNGGIVPRAEFETTMLSDADTIEVVRFVGGG